MGDRIPAPLRRLGGIFSSFTTGQKAVTILGILALAIGGYFFATWASKPAMAPLFSNLSGEDAAAIVENLSGTGVEYELTDGGKTIMVPNDQVYDLRIQMSGEGLPAQADTGYALLDKQGVTTSDFMQHIGYQRALEGELTKTITSIDGVQGANVHLVLPQKDIFSDDEKKTTASVMITTRAGASLDDEQVQAIVHLVASSVEGLDPKNVTVADAAGTVLSTGDGRGTAGGASGGDQRDKATSDFDTRMNSAVTKMLENLVGPGKAIVKTTSELDFDETETKSQRYVADPAVPPLTETTKNEKYTGAGSGSGGVLGPDNIQVPNGANGGSGQYDSTEEARRNAVGVVEETRKAAPGSVRRLSVSVLLDQTTAAGIDQTQVQQMVSAAVGLNPQRGDTMAVTMAPFSTAAADSAKADSDKATAAEKNEQLLGMAKTGGLVLIVLILILLAWLGSRKKRKKLTDDEIAQLAEMQAALIAEADAARAIEGGRGARALEAGSDDGVNRREEISEMVANQPEEVAVLLRSWLADRRG
ncbi:flagellar M-ring protein [Pilimelia anulata]|uniref:Flagellar M-ring protein n=1 Tax=Pilimelia anulata TaxID=53371 RepID=A0A8J3B7M7_9ACTN|nr:flagellar basal-body MS-ring/collar protein FliF [Pilimelia anulata]GGJ82531.1 flagellar M-ring protein [Pilimelia anulata]